MLELYAIADGKAEPGPGHPTVVICMDEFGPLNLQPTRADNGRRSRTDPVTGPGRDVAGGLRTTARTASVTLLAGYDFSTDRLYGNTKLRNDRTRS